MVNIHLQTGTWKIYGNNEKGHLVIKSVDSSGKITGTAFGHEIQGVFNESSGEIQFSVRRNPKLLDAQVFTGYISLVEIGVDRPEFLLGGYYITIPFGIGVKYGWYATIEKMI